MTNFKITHHHALTEEIAPFKPDRRYAIPRRIHATAVEEELGLDLDLEIDVGDRGETRCRRVDVRAPDGGDVTGETLRRIPLAHLAGVVLATAAWKVTGPTTMQTGMARSERVEFYERHARGARRPRQGTPIADDTLRQVAGLYRAAYERGDPPTQTVADEMHVARSTAARWVTRARERELLGPALRGRAGEKGQP